MVSVTEKAHKMCQVRTGKANVSEPLLIIHRLNQMMRGWANYFKHAVVKHVFSKIGWYARTRATRWLRERHKGRKRMTWKEFRRRYIVPVQGLVVAGIRLFNPGTVPVTRYRYRGDTIPTPWVIP